MNVFSVVLILATMGCGLVAGITLVFAVVIMPGLKSLGDRGFLEGFKAIDRVIQDNQPIFMLVWLGSAVALIVATFFGVGSLQGLERALLIVALVVYLIGVQLATVVVNIPLNNDLQAQDLDQLEATEISRVRGGFEPRWNRWNIIRTWFAILTTLLLLVLLLRM